MIDTSEVAIALAAERAGEAGVDVTLVHSDLTAATLPDGPWDLVLIVHYLQRDLFSPAIDTLADDGLIAFLGRHRSEPATPGATIPPLPPPRGRGAVAR